MKRFSIALALAVALFAPVFDLASAAKCTYNDGDDVLSNIAQDGCKPTGSLTTGEDASIGSARDRAVIIANNIITVGSLIAVGAVIYSGALFVFSIGKDVKKAKASLIHALLGFALMLLAFPIVNATINLVFSLNH